MPDRPASHARLAEGCPHRLSLPAAEPCCPEFECGPGGRRPGEAVGILDCLACVRRHGATPATTDPPGPTFAEKARKARAALAVVPECDYRSGPINGTAGACGCSVRIHLCGLARGDSYPDPRWVRGADCLRCKSAELDG